MEIKDEGGDVYKNKQQPVNKNIEVMLCQSALGIKPKIKETVNAKEDTNTLLMNRPQSRSTLARKMKAIGNVEKKNLNQYLAPYRGIDKSLIMQRISGQTFTMNNRVVFDLPIEKKAISYAAN